MNEVPLDIQYLPILKFEKTHELAKLPTKSHEEDAGYDVYSVENVVLKSKTNKMIDVGLKFADIPSGYWIEPRSRSGLWFKHGIRVFGGVIDENFRGVAGVSLINESDVDYEIKVGDRIAQFVIHMKVDMKVDWGKTVETTRGANGFGSTNR